MHSTFHEESYSHHSKHYNDFIEGGGKADQAKTWLRDDTVDAWRHQRMYATIDPILQVDTQSTWLTVGDGRYGTDAHAIIAKGGKALATDLTDVLLREAQTKGFISEYQVENAEQLSFEDETFDYAFCKESYHHFPRPAVALYEMLRVARKGVVLIEPNDPYSYDVTDTLLRTCVKSLRNIIRKLLGKKSNLYAFEPTGNYLFSLSKREIEKVALGLNYKAVAFYELNDYYQEGVEQACAVEHDPVYQKVQNSIHHEDMLTKVGYRDYGLLVAIIFKTHLSTEMERALSKYGYTIMKLPQNPYIQ